MNKFYTILQTCWDWRAAANFIFGGTGSALILMLALSSFSVAPPTSAWLAALVFIALGLFMVWLEIGRPWRFLHVYFHPQTSWMTREASVAFALFIIALIGILFEFTPALILAGLLGLLFLFCQAQILLDSKGIPSWREPILSPLIISTGLVEGTAFLSLFALFFNPEQRWTWFFLIIFLAARTYFWMGYRQKLIDNKAPKKTLSVLSDIDKPTRLVGNIVPLILVIVALMFTVVSSLLIFIASLLAVIGGWYMKFTIITRAAQQQGYSLGKLKRGRPVLKDPVRRKPDKFVF